MADRKRKRTATQGSDVYDAIDLVNEVSVFSAEMAADHATFKATVDALETLAEELKADFNLLRLNFINSGHSAAGLAEGTNASTIKTVNTFQYSIGGQRYTKAATDNIAFTATAQQAISTYCLYLVSINSAGTVTVTKGTEVATDTAVLPALPASSAPLGWVKVATNGATTFTGGTTDLSAAGITATFADLHFVNSGADASTAIAAADPPSGPATLTATAPSGDRILSPAGVAYT